MSQAEADRLMVFQAKQGGQGKEIEMLATRKMDASKGRQQLEALHDALESCKTSRKQLTK